VFTFVSAEERAALAEIEAVLGAPIPRRSEPGFDDDSPTPSARRDRAPRGHRGSPSAAHARGHHSPAAAPIGNGAEKSGAPRRRGRRRPRPAEVSAS